MLLLLLLVGMGMLVEELSHCLLGLAWPGVAPPFNGRGGGCRTSSRMPRIEKCNLLESVYTGSHVLTARCSTGDVVVVGELGCSMQVAEVTREADGCHYEAVDLMKE